MARFTGKIVVAAAALPTGFFTAVEKARSSVQPQPPMPDTWDSLIWLASGQDPLAAFIALASGTAGGWAIWQMFQPAAYSEQQGRDDSQRQSQAFATADSEAERRHQILLAEIEKLRLDLLGRPGVSEQQAQNFATVVSELASSSNSAERAIAAQALSGNPLAAVDELLTEIEGSADQNAARARQAGQLAAPFSVEKGIAAYSRAIEFDPDDFWTRYKLVALFLSAGSLRLARSAAETALSYAVDDWQRSMVEIELGDLCELEGDLDAAQKHYRAANSIYQSNVVEYPDDPERKRDLLVSQVKLGHIACLLEDLDEAEHQFQEVLPLAEELLSDDSGYADNARDLSVIYGYLGRIELARDNVDEAGQYYIQAHNVIESQVALDPVDPEYRRALSVSNENLGDVAKARGDLGDASNLYRQSLVIRQRLADDDPSNSDWQRDLAVAHFKLGNINSEKGSFNDAKHHYDKSITILEALAEKDPSNTEFQQRLTFSHSALGRVVEAEGDTPAAIRQFELAQAILLGLLKQVGEHPQFSRNLENFQDELDRLRER